MKSKSRKYPEGTKFNEWRLVVQNQRGVDRFAIWRWIKFPDKSTKLERLPVSNYRTIRENEVELRKLVLRLNDAIPKKDRVKIVVDLKHAYIDSTLLDEFKDHLMAQIPSRGKATTTYHYAYEYFIRYFVADLGLNNPVDWHLVHETKWATYLLGPDCPKSADAKKAIVAASNRFIAWLHKRRPNEVPPLLFKPLTTAKLKQVEAIRRMRGQVRIRQMIKDVDYKIIVDRSPQSIRPFIELAYHYGLRRSESMGLKKEDIRNGFLSVERQLVAFTRNTPVYGPLKGRQARHCPHWFCTADQTYRWISAALESKMHPDTFTDQWNKLMDDLKMKYDIHDLRHTWVTKAIREHSPRDVQLAAGHKNIQTTMRYAHDDRELDSKIFTPNAS